MNVENQYILLKNKFSWFLFQQHFVNVFEKKIERSFRVRRTGDDERRKAVKMDIKIGNEVFSAVFSLADRKDFDYQGLVGRNILTGSFIVDTSTSYTLN